MGIRMGQEQDYEDAGTVVKTRVVYFPPGKASAVRPAKDRQDALRICRAEADWHPIIEQCTVTRTPWQMVNTADALREMEA